MGCRILVVVMVMAAWPRAAGAAGPDDNPDLEIAQRRFVKGSEYYAAKSYEKAIEEFEAARRVMPAPEIDFNIARCLDRLERFQEAIVAYERYLGAAKDAADAAEVRERVGVLRTRVGQTPAAVPVPVPV